MPGRRLLARLGKRVLRPGGLEQTEALLVDLAACDLDRGDETRLNARENMAMETLPEGLTAYSRSPTFDERSLPAALQREDRTKAGAWALLHVLEGRLLYRILEPFSEHD